MLLVEVELCARQQLLKLCNLVRVDSPIGFKLFKLRLVGYQGLECFKHGGSGLNRLSTLAISFIIRIVELQDLLVEARGRPQQLVDGLDKEKVLLGLRLDN